MSLDEDLPTMAEFVENVWTELGEAELYLRDVVEWNADQDHEDDKAYIWAWF